MVIIDTSAWVEFFRTSGELEIKMAVKSLLDVLEGAICGPVEMEFLGGAGKDEILRIRGLFSLLPYIRNDMNLWGKTAENFSRMRAAGYTLPWNDVMIATISIERNLRVFAKDKHFPLMAEILGMRLYTPGCNGSYNPEP